MLTTISLSPQRFKAGVDSQESRRRREEESVNVRKNKREEGLAKRRQMNEIAGGGEAATLEEIAPQTGGEVVALSTPTLPSRALTAADIWL